MNHKKPEEAGDTSGPATTLNAWAVVSGIDQQTLQRRLVKAGMKIEPRTLIPAADIFRVMIGGREEALTRKLNAEALKLEREEKTAEKELVSIPDAEREIWQKWIFPFWQEIQVMPQKLAPLICPEDPARAERILDDWKEQTKKLVKERQ
jgi:hypothetical protein